MKKNKKILLAIDGSEQSLTAVRYVSRVFSKQAEVVLFPDEADWIEAGKRKIVPALNKAQIRLMQAGFSEERVSSEILTYEKSRAAAIVKAAGSAGYDTIVLGRRGFTSVGEFTIGRVSRKILHLTFQPALWIVN